MPNFIFLRFFSFVCKNMKIKSPLTDKKEVESLVEAGADEFFCGIEPIEWRRKFRDFSINQRSTHANFTRLIDLEKAIIRAHSLKAKVHVAINAFFYSEEQYKNAILIIKEVLRRGADGIIFADLGLLINVPASLLQGKHTIIGTDMVIFNRQAASFCKRLGAKRIVIPRSITIDELKDVVTNAGDMEYEVFIIHDLCFFEHGFCAYCKEASGMPKKQARLRKKVYLFSASRLMARGFEGGCRSRFSCLKVSLNTHKRIETMRNFHFWTNKHIDGCGACALYDFKKLGIKAVKVLDRNFPTQEKIRATMFIRKSLDFLKDTQISKDDYMQKCRELFKKTFGSKCDKYDCYYPSVFR